MKYLLDSNIIIYHLNGEKTASDFEWGVEKGQGKALTTRTYAVYYSVAL